MRAVVTFRLVWISASLVFSIIPCISTFIPSCSQYSRKGFFSSTPSASAKSGVDEDDMSLRETKPVVLNVNDAKSVPFSGGDGSKFSATISQIGKAIGAGGIGATYLQVEPGRRAFPFHNHLGNDELFVILEGGGNYRFGPTEYPVRAGDVCAAPRGGPEVAHQIVNTGDVTLRYLAISTTNDPDVVEYPDSGKYAALAVAPGKDFFHPHLRVAARVEDGVDYWEGEL